SSRRKERHLRSCDVASGMVEWQSSHSRMAASPSPNGYVWFRDSPQKSSAARSSVCVSRALSCRLPVGHKEACCGHCSGRLTMLDSIRQIRLEDLILSKPSCAKDSGSEVQLRDVRNLLDSLCD